LSTISIHHADNLAFLKAYRGKPIDLIYIDPPFNTGKVQQRQRMRSIADDDGDRTGFAGKRYRTEAIESASYDDSFGDDFIDYLRERI
jgi:site-specific DNA-methyltransferase (adenine-specific)